MNDRSLKLLWMFVACLALVATATCLVGFTKPGDGNTKTRECRVYLRRDAAKGDSGSWQDALDGTLKKIDRDWVVIEDEYREAWVPRSMVLYIRFPKAQTAREERTLAPGVLRIDGVPVQPGVAGSTGKR